MKGLRIVERERELRRTQLLQRLADARAALKQQLQTRTVAQRDLDQSRERVRSMLAGHEPLCVQQLGLVQAQHESAAAALVLAEQRTAAAEAVVDEFQTRLLRIEKDIEKLQEKITTVRAEVAVEMLKHEWTELDDWILARRMEQT